ncbi:MAG: phosphatidylglycerophosphatase A [Planctomycetes bacterium]|nr:phosphatidylglycerophosphatase A [Planctomycetota bacterium]
MSPSPASAGPARGAATSGDGERPSRWRRALGTAGGLGLLPKAPGTWGSLGTVLVAVPLLGLAGGPAGVLPAEAGAARLVVLAACALLFAIGVRVGDRAPTDFGTEDPGAFVLDEVVGQLLALLPALGSPIPWWKYLAAFALFRLFDVTKPPPCRRLESLHGGLGIMADDVAAGVYAALVLLLVARLV